MTTAVQPNELVFEFASNGMDEINQVCSFHCLINFRVINLVVVV